MVNPWFPCLYYSKSGEIMEIGIYSECPLRSRLDDFVSLCWDNNILTFLLCHCRMGCKPKKEQHGSCLYRLYAINDMSWHQLLFTDGLFIALLHEGTAMIVIHLWSQWPVICSYPHALSWPYTLHTCKPGRPAILHVGRPHHRILSVGEWRTSTARSRSQGEKPVPEVSGSHLHHSSGRSMYVSNMYGLLVQSFLLGLL